MEKLDKERYLKRVIVVCWIALAVCFGIKLFGGNLFEIMCENENFIKVCEYADNHFWVRYIMGLLNAIVSIYFFILAVCGKIKYTKTQLIILCVSMPVCNFIKMCHTMIGLICDVCQMILLPSLFIFMDKTDKKRLIWVFVGNILLFIFQTISLFVKNLQFGILVDTNNVVTNTIFSIDVILMVVLYYLYSNSIQKKGG